MKNKTKQQTRTRSREKMRDKKTKRNLPNKKIEKSKQASRRRFMAS